MRKPSFLHGTSMALVLAAGSHLCSQQATGSLSGEVSGPNGKALAGAKVILSSPALFSARTLTTTPNGSWRATGLPAGNYRIQVIADGYLGSEVRDVRLGMGASLTQNLTLRRQEVANATVEVVSLTTEMDKSETKTSMNFSSSLLEAISVDRGFNGAADLTPGVTFGPNNNASIRGGTTMDTAFRINGTDIQDDYQGQVVGRYYIEDNIEDVQVMLSPLNARYGRNTGGAINAVTKSGGDQFSGSIRTTVSKPSWDAKTPFSSVNDTQKGPTNREYQVAVSGPIIKERLWFSLGTVLTPSTTSATWWNGPGFSPSVARTGNASIDAVTAAGPGSGYTTQMFPGIHSFNEVANENYYDLKLTGQILTDHILEFAVVNRTLDIKDRGTWWSDVPILRNEDATKQTDKNSVYTLTYRGVLSSSAFLEAGWNVKLWSMTPPQGDPAYGNKASIYLYGDNRALAYNPFAFLGNAWTYGTPAKEERNNQHAWANLNLFLDAGKTRHELDLGLEFFDSTHKQGSQFGTDNEIIRVAGAYQGTDGSFLFPTIRWTDYGAFGQSPNGALGLAPIMRIYSGHDGTAKNESYGAYANDNWTINAHWQAMFGVRLDTQRVKDIDGARLASSTEFSPRLQVRYDLGGDNKRLVTFTAARFVSDFSTGFTSAFVKSARSAYTGYGWSGIGSQPLPGTPNDLVNGSQAYGVRFVTYADLTNPANYTGRNGATAFQAWDSSRVYQISPDLKPPSVDEFTLGIRRNFDGGDYVRLTSVYRRWRQNWAFATDWAADQMVAIPDPSGKLATQYTPSIHVFNSNELFRQFTDLELEFRQTLSRRWSLTGGYTYGHLIGNTEGGQQSGSSFRDTSVSGYYGQRRALLAMGLKDQDIAPTGRLMNDQSNHGRLVIVGTFPVGSGDITLAWTILYDSGAPWSATNGAPITGLPPRPANTAAAPTAYTQFYGGRGIYEMNDTYSSNLKVTWRFPLGKGLPTVFGDVSAQNLFNHMLQSGYNTQIYSPSSGANALWLVNNPLFGQANPTDGNYWMTGRHLSASLGLRF
ncbi:MAG: TonB-dependent receptor [Acidobacteria bacterium]|nr:TonB-dependent receptor [Acidobacteriota bacterium]MBI3489686.1 TonB-dependent receptor [Acidobacteriota bacterium]